MMRVRRQSAGRLAEMRAWLSPVNWSRLGRYQMLRLLRLSGSPYAVAMGCAAGVGISMTPLLGFHIVLAVVVAWLLRGNLVAAVIGTFAGNPLTFPFIWGATYKLGTLMMGHAASDPPAQLEHDLLHKSFDQIRHVVEPMLLGSVPLSLIAGALTFAALSRLLEASRQGRRARLANRRLRRDPSVSDVPTASESAR